MRKLKQRVGVAPGSKEGQAKFEAQLQQQSKNFNEMLQRRKGLNIPPPQVRKKKKPQLTNSTQKRSVAGSHQQKEVAVDLGRNRANEKRLKHKRNEEEEEENYGGDLEENSRVAHKHPSLPVPEEGKIEQPPETAGQRSPATISKKRSPSPLSAEEEERPEKSSV